MGRSLQHKIGVLDVWETPFAEVQANLKSGIGLCERWCETLSELTSLWKEDPDCHEWSGPSYTDSFMMELGRRFLEILSLRKTCEELNRVLADERNSTTKGFDGVGDISLSKHFADLKPLLYNHHTDHIWLKYQSHIQNICTTIHSQAQGCS